MKEQDKSIMKNTFQRLFTPLEIKQKTIHYELLIRSKDGICYNVRFTKRSGHEWLSGGRGWLVSKFKFDNWTSLTMTRQERQMVIDYCKEHLGDAMGV